MIMSTARIAPSPTPYWYRRFIYEESPPSAASEVWIPMLVRGSTKIGSVPVQSPRRGR